MTANPLETEASKALEAILFGAAAAGPAKIGTPALLAAMLAAGDGISDLVFSPGRPPQVEQHGELEPVAVPEVPVLLPEDTARVARELIGGNELTLQTLK